MHRRRLAGLAVITVAALTTAACSGSTGGAPVVTVTQTSYQSSPSAGGGSGASSASGSGSSAPSGSSASSGTSGAGSASSSGSTDTGAPTGSPSTSTESPSSPSGTGTSASTSTSSSKPTNPNAEPDGFVPHKLKPGEKPPQFIAVSFDGAGWDDKWQYYFNIAKKVPFHFTANLTGLYLLDKAHKDAYKGPGHPAGATALGADSWNDPAEVKQEVIDLNQAYDDGDELATHFMGHFCDSAGSSPGGNSWDTAQWNDELDQFFNVLNNYQSIDKIPGLPALKFTARDVTGERTPCLEGSQEKLYPALVKHHMDYDQSFTRHGIVWPDQSPKYKIWDMGMAEFPMHGSIPQYGPNHFQITMDYNLWYSQEFNPSTNQMNETTEAQATQDSKQVQATYQDMLDGALAGSHAPLLLGNHFNDWNHNAYTKALGNFLLANCGKPNIHCVPYRDVIDWMKMQDPKVLAQLQAEPPITGPPGSHNK